MMVIFVGIRVIFYTSQLYILWYDLLYAYLYEYMYIYVKKAHA